MSHADAFRRCLVELDVDGIQRLWAEAMPHLPRPSNDGEAFAALHYARSVASSVPNRLRFYSHRWLLDNGLPSGLPDELKPKAERLYPRVSEGVGISVNARSELFKPVTGQVQKSMELAVEEAYAAGRTDTPFVRTRMFEARQKTIKRLLGI